MLKKTFTCQGYRGMDTYKGAFTVEADTYEDAFRKALAERPFADCFDIVEDLEEMR